MLQDNYIRKNIFLIKLSVLPILTKTRTKVFNFFACILISLQDTVIWTAFTWQMQVANGKRTLNYWLKV